MNLPMFHGMEDMDAGRLKRLRHSNGSPVDVVQQNLLSMRPGQTYMTDAELL